MQYSVCHGNLVIEWPSWLLEKWYFKLLRRLMFNQKKICATLWLLKSREYDVAKGLQNVTVKCLSCDFLSLSVYTVLYDNCLAAYCVDFSSVERSTMLIWRGFHLIIITYNYCQFSDNYCQFTRLLLMYPVTHVITVRWHKLHIGCALWE